MYRLVLLFVSALFLAGCGSLWQGASDTVLASFSSQKQTLHLTRAEVDNRPYFQILVQTANTEALLILTRATGPYRYWQSSAQESLIMAHGFIQRTTGLADNIEQTRFIGTNPFAIGLHKISDNSQAIREMDLSGYRYGIRVTSVFHVRAIEPVTILDETRQLLRVDEEITAPDIALKATNHYWLDDTGFIWKSEQTLWPDFSITVTQLRPYEDDAL